MTTSGVSEEYGCVDELLTAGGIVAQAATVNEPLVERILRCSPADADR
jgi:hypothetical protein